MSEPSDSLIINPQQGSIEDREQTRSGVDCAVTVDSEHNFYAGVARNLSVGGIFLATPIVHPVGTRFDLSIHIDDGDDRVIRGVGEVRWVRALDRDDNTPAGLGIRFVELDHDGTKRINRFLEQREPMLVENDTAPTSNQ